MDRRGWGGKRENDREGRLEREGLRGRRRGEGRGGRRDEGGWKYTKRRGR